MQFELTSEYLSALREDIERRDSTVVAAKVEDLYPQDIAEILDEVSLEEAQFIFRLLNDEERSEVLMELGRGCAQTLPSLSFIRRNSACMSTC
jgi:magnesium transporter